MAGKHGKYTGGGGADRKSIGTCVWCGQPAYKRSSARGELEPFCLPCYMQVYRTGSPEREQRALTEVEYNACLRLRRRDPKKWTVRALAERLEKRGFSVKTETLRRILRDRPYKDYPFYQ